MFDKIRKAYRNPEKIIPYLNSKGVFSFLSDEQHVRFMYYSIFKKKLNLSDPKTFNEKLQWLKLYNRKPEYTMMVDKYRVRKYIADKLGEEYLIPLLGVWDDPDDIDFDALPNQFVLKCNHNSGLGMCICKDKSKLDINKAKAELRKGLHEDYYIKTREWPYKDVPRKIIAEKYMVDESGYELKDYKIFCFDGFAKALYVALDRQSETEEMKWNFYDMEFHKLPFWNAHPNTESEIRRPESFERMKELAGMLSQGIPHVRVDFYDVNGQIYFGEMTFFHNSGFTQFHPEEWDRTFGEWIKLPYSLGGGYLIASKGYILYLHESQIKDINDYKFFCFNGVCKCMKVDFDRFIQHRANYFDPEGNRLDFGEVICPPDPQRCTSLPKNIDKMIELAEKLSREQPFMRADFYDVNGDIYFGEITFFPASGMGKFIPEEWDYKLGEWLELPKHAGGGYLTSVDDIIIMFKYKRVTDGLKDYKLMCFGGEPKMTLVCTERFTEKGLHEDFFDMEWNHLAIKRPNTPQSEVPIECPRNYQLMQQLATKLAVNMPFVRVDFYEVNGKVYFGEITFFPTSGMKDFVDDWDYKLGEMIDLSEMTKKPEL